MSKIMELADAYGECLYLRQERHEARAALQAEDERMEAEIERLRVALHEFGDHLESCPKHGCLLIEAFAPKCECGFDAAREVQG
jgi:hypothetical protein